MTVTKEQIEEFLAKGGKIKILRPQDDRFAHHHSRYHFGSGLSALSIGNMVDKAFMKSKKSRRKRNNNYPKFKGKG
jgi:hypothetical protein